MKLDKIYNSSTCSILQLIRKMEWILLLILSIQEPLSPIYTFRVLYSQVIHTYICVNF